MATLVTGTASPTLFLSYAWADKSLARRVARRLRHRGLDVWLDESEMQAGDALPGRIRTAIQSRSHLLVLLTEASVHSSWVSREIAFARELSPEVTVVPITGETNVSSPLLDETLGVDVSDTALLEARLDELVHSIGGNPAERDVVLMRPDLEQLGHELPLLSAIQLSEPQSHAFFDALPIDASTSTKSRPLSQSSGTSRPRLATLKAPHQRAALHRRCTSPLRPQASIVRMVLATTS